MIYKVTKGIDCAKLFSQKWVLFGATNTENTTQNRSHGGEPDKMTLCSHTTSQKSQIFKVPRRKKTKKNRRRRRGRRRPSDFLFLCFFHFSKGRTRSRMEKQTKKKREDQKENWEKKKKSSPQSARRTKRRQSLSAQHARTFSRSEPSVTMFTLSTSATVSSVRASRLLCVSAFSNGCHVALSLVSFFCAKT